ncbi:MAG: peptidoglycan hydrolase CwlO-like protein [Flavobacteriales bacterium]|jgi:peptidoglycan hydrolase CwlO-like protein
MEVLNRNQRRSALWRLVAILGIIVAMVSVVLWAMGTSKGGNGEAQVQELRDSISDIRDQFDGRILGLENQIAQLEKDLADATGDESQQEKIDDLEKEIESLEKEIDNYKVDIRVLNFKVANP